MIFGLYFFLSYIFRINILRNSKFIDTCQIVLTKKNLQRQIVRTRLFRRKAHVHCVIIGFSYFERKEKLLLNEKGECSTVSTINP